MATLLDGASLTLGDDSDTTVTAGNATSGWNVTGPYVWGGPDPNFPQSPASHPGYDVQPGGGGAADTRVVWGG